MPQTITKSGTTTTPTLVTGYEVTSTVDTITHALIGGDVAYSMTPGRPRTGELELIYATKAAAFTAFELHRLPGIVTLTDTDLGPQTNMRYVVTGDLTIQLDPDTRRFWTVTVPFSEVTT